MECLDILCSRWHYKNKGAPRALSQCKISLPLGHPRANNAQNSSISRLADPPGGEHAAIGAKGGGDKPRSTLAQELSYCCLTTGAGHVSKIKRAWARGKGGGMTLSNVLYCRRLRPCASCEIRARAAQGVLRCRTQAGAHRCPIMVTRGHPWNATIQTNRYCWMKYHPMHALVFRRGC